MNPTPLSEEQSPASVSLAPLRGLRLYHWLEVVEYRRLAADYPRTDLIRCYNAKADMHLKFVQTLNEFFPVGDTAEQDVPK